MTASGDSINMGGVSLISDGCSTERLCLHRRRAAFYTSRSTKNPGRRFFRCSSCMLIKGDDCSYFECYDHPLRAKERDVIVPLFFVVKDALRSRGLKDDTTCLVVDINPSNIPIIPSPPAPKKKQKFLNSLLFGKKSQSSMNKSSKLSAVGAVEELFEEGSAVLAERLGKNIPDQNSGIIKCAVCQADQPLDDQNSGIIKWSFFSDIEQLPRRVDERCDKASMLFKDLCTSCDVDQLLPKQHLLCNMFRSSDSAF